MPAERFRAMGTSALVVVTGAETLLARARRRIAELEGRWSRFRSDSEITRLNQANGAPLAVTDDTLRLLQTAVAAWRLTDGRCDATVFDAMVRNGYDRTFDEVDRTRLVSPVHRPTHGCADIEVDLDRNAVRLPGGAGIDPGGIGKGLAADMVVQELMDAGARGALVDIGGDIRCDGIAPHGGAWIIDVESPFADTPLAHLVLASGAVATSSCLKRRWSAHSEVHHIIDPRTGMPANTTVAAATVFASEAWVAEALAKAVIVAGHIEAAGDAPLIAVHYDGRVVASKVPLGAAA